ncbi:type IV toxin-antitoxin system AbiEi family antitoxin [Bradyrhizobium glycinis]|uniref:type IV toxin-antitoxin system AbiEi family antitoxin n=1 Tax=Bradyrhizobium glycinis TaxID=2751812 RepID=UPI001FE8B530|nr:type IV toxin-antitoxin system AbiEi family antitoxin [Bradyrhizobium glycinis]
MKHEGHPYYVGLLKAAEIHGASHQAVMQFQTVTDKWMPKIRAGRSVLSFFYRKDIGALSGAIVDQKTDTGRFELSSPELTGLDLLRYMHVTGTIDSIASVLSDLGAKMKAHELQKLAPAFERSVYPAPRIHARLRHTQPSSRGTARLPAKQETAALGRTRTVQA